MLILTVRSMIQSPSRREKKKGDGSRVNGSIGSDSEGEGKDEEENEEVEEEEDCDSVEDNG